jgi:hypothetical protein
MERFGPTPARPLIAKTNSSERADRGALTASRRAYPPVESSGAHFCIFVTSVPAAWMHWLY